ncbi:MAG: folate-binding protein [Gammaproteobacteria bacterium]
MLRSVVLADRRLLVIGGPDRVAFLQGQLTQDVAIAGAGLGTIAGWADAKGRLMFAGHLLRIQVDAEDTLALLVPAEMAETLLKRLRMYVLRAKVTLAIADLPILGLFGPPPQADAASVRLHGADDRYLILGPAAECLRTETIAGEPADWDLAEIRAGIPGIVSATAGEFVPQMVNLDLLGGISFTKGCYTGQEIVARLKYLGRLKRRMLRFSAADEVPAAGAALFVGHSLIGQVVVAAPTPTGSEFLAVIRLDGLPGPFYLDEAQTRPVRRLELPYEVPV